MREYKSKKRFGPNRYITFGIVLGMLIFNLSVLFFPQRTNAQWHDMLMEVFQVGEKATETAAKKANDIYEDMAKEFGLRLSHQTSQILGKAAAKAVFGDFGWQQLKDEFQKMGDAALGDFVNDIVGMDLCTLDPSMKFDMVLGVPGFRDDCDKKNLEKLKKEYGEDSPEYKSVSRVCKPKCSFSQMADHLKSIDWANVVDFDLKLKEQYDDDAPTDADVFENNIAFTDCLKIDDECQDNGIGDFYEEYKAIAKALFTDAKFEDIEQYKEETVGFVDSQAWEDGNAEVFKFYENSYQDALNSIDEAYYAYYGDNEASMNALAREGEFMWDFLYISHLLDLIESTSPLLFGQIKTYGAGNYSAFPGKTKNEAKKYLEDKIGNFTNDTNAEKPLKDKVNTFKKEYITEAIQKTQKNTNKLRKCTQEQGLICDAESARVSADCSDLVKDLCFSKNNSSDQINNLMGKICSAALGTTGFTGNIEIDEGDCVNAYHGQWSPSACYTCIQSEGNALDVITLNDRYKEKTSCETNGGAWAGNACYGCKSGSGTDYYGNIWPDKMYILNADNVLTEQVCNDTYEQRLWVNSFCNIDQSSCKDLDGVWVPVGGNQNAVGGYCLSESAGQCGKRLTTLDQMTNNILSRLNLVSKMLDTLASTAERIENDEFVNDPTLLSEDDTAALIKGDSNDVASQLKVQGGALAEGMNKQVMETTNQAMQGPIKSATTKVSEVIKTPGALAQDMFDDNSKSPTMKVVGDFFKDTFDAFSVTAYQMGMKKLMKLISGGPGNKEETQNNAFKELEVAQELFGPESGFSPSKRANYEPAGPLEIPNEEIFPAVNMASDYDLIALMGSCAQVTEGVNQSPTSCVFNANFTTFVAQGGTIQEAFDQGVLKSDYVIGMNSDGKQPGINEGFTINQIKRMRQARLMPLGLEFAADLINACHDSNLKALPNPEGGTINVPAGLYHMFPDNPALAVSYYNRCSEIMSADFGQIIDGFDKRGPDNVCNLDPAESPFCNLVNPDWFIKSVGYQCAQTGYSDLLTSNLSGNRQEECVNLQTCLESGEENCSYGYCLKERNIWQTGGETCPAYYDSCQNFLSDNTTYPLLKNTLSGLDICSRENSDCQWYSSYKQLGNWVDLTTIDNLTECVAQGGEWYDNRCTNTRLYFNGNVAECDSQNSGCSQLISISQAGSNWIINGSFENTLMEAFPQDWKLTYSGASPLKYDKCIGYKYLDPTVCQNNGGTWNEELQTCSGAYRYDTSYSQCINAGMGTSYAKGPFDEDGNAFITEEISFEGGKSLEWGFPYDGTFLGNSSLVYALKLPDDQGLFEESDIYTVSFYYRPAMTNLAINNYILKVIFESYSNGNLVDLTEKSVNLEFPYWNRESLTIGASGPGNELRLTLKLERFADDSATTDIDESQNLSDIILNIDALKLERNTVNQLLSQNLTSAYVNYTDNTKIYAKVPPEYLECNGIDTTNPAPVLPYGSEETCKDNNGFWQNQGQGENRCYQLPLDSDACRGYALKCSSDEVGCQSYKQVGSNEPSIQGVAKLKDYCPAECVGYDTYFQQATYYEPLPTPAFSHFIPETANQCLASEVGCDAFTNLESIAAGGENVEYYSYLRQCIKPNLQLGDNTYYTWEGSDSEGYVLTTYNLQSEGNYVCQDPTYNNQTDCESSGSQWYYNVTSSAPKVISGHCTDGESMNEPECNLQGENWTYDCRVDFGFDPDCREFYDDQGDIYYRYLSKTVNVSNDCKRYRKNDSNESVCRATNGQWINSQCIYNAITKDAVSCKAQAVGCREYVGNRGSNFVQTFYDQFEGGSSNWENAVISSESTRQGGHSLLIENDSANRNIFNLNTGQRYSLSFWAKTEAGQSTDLEIKFSDTPQGQEFSNFSNKVITITDSWRLYSLGPIEFNWETTQNKISISKRSGQAGTQVFLDNISLRQINDTFYLVKNSWSTPNSCDRNYLGAAEPQAMLGCKAYQNTLGNQVYLKSFTNICRVNAVGCQAYYNTYNSNSPFDQEFNRDNDIFGTQSTYYDNVVVPKDSLGYFVVNQDNLCQSNNKGCKELGRADIIATGINYSSTYLIDDPDSYEGTSNAILCSNEALGCKTFTDADGNDLYFKLGVGKDCEYSESIGGWVKKGTNIGCSVDLEGVGPYEIIYNDDPLFDLDEAGYVGYCQEQYHACTKFLHSNPNYLTNGSFETVNQSSLVGSWNIAGSGISIGASEDSYVGNRSLELKKLVFKGIYETGGNLPEIINDTRDQKTPLVYQRLPRLIKGSPGYNITVHYKVPQESLGIQTASSGQCEAPQAQVYLLRKVKNLGQVTATVDISDYEIISVYSNGQSTIIASQEAPGEVGNPGVGFITDAWKTLNFSFQIPTWFQQCNNYDTICRSDANCNGVANSCEKLEDVCLDNIYDNTGACVNSVSKSENPDVEQEYLIALAPPDDNKCINSYILYDAVEVKVMGENWEGYTMIDDNKLDKSSCTEEDWNNGCVKFFNTSTKADEILSVERDRECDLWLECENETAVSGFGQGLTQCHQVSTCQNQDAGGCITPGSKYDNFFYDSPTEPLLVNFENYQQRFGNDYQPITLWRAGDYDGYTIPYHFPLDSDYGFVTYLGTCSGTSNTGQGNVPCVEDSECDNGFCQKGFELTCRSYPQEDAPYFRPIIIGVDYPNYSSANFFSSSETDFANINTCNYLEAGSGSAKTFLSHIAKNTVQRICTGNAGSGSENNVGKWCDEHRDKDGVNYSGDYWCGDKENGNGKFEHCEPLRTIHQRQGYKGVCLEYDTSYPVAGSDKDYACMTWYPYYLYDGTPYEGQEVLHNICLSGDADKLYKVCTGNSDCGSGGVCGDGRQYKICQNGDLGKICSIDSDCFPQGTDPDDIIAGACEEQVEYRCMNLNVFSEANLKTSNYFNKCTTDADCNYKIINSSGLEEDVVAEPGSCRPYY